MDKLKNSSIRENLIKKYITIRIPRNRTDQIYRDERLQNLNRRRNIPIFVHSNRIIGKSEKKKKKEYVRNYFDRSDLKKASFPRIDTLLMVEMWRKGRVFRASAKKPPLQKDRGDVEKGDGEKNGGRWPRKNASLRSAASATKLFFQESRRHRRALLSAAVFLFIPLLRNAYIRRPAASRKEKRREGNGNRRNRRERNERAT